MIRSLYYEKYDKVLLALDYSRISRHLVATAGDEGSVHLWDTTGHNPKVRHVFDWLSTFLAIHTFLVMWMYFSVD